MFHPFSYDLNFFYLPGSSSHVMICFHGYGDDHEIAIALSHVPGMHATLVSFDLPDACLKYGKIPQEGFAFGSLRELLPALYALKETVFKRGLDSIDLYGFSAGGGTVVNLIRLLYTTRHEEELASIGIGKQEKEILLSAIQKGLVILDAPLKSVEEILEDRGFSPELEQIARNYKENNLRPIDSVQDLKGLHLDVLLYFELGDEILSNEDDALYIANLKGALQEGNLKVLTGRTGGHTAMHEPLWREYRKKRPSK